MSIETDPRPDATEDGTNAPGGGSRAIVSVVVASVSTLILWAAAPDAVNATFSGPGPFLRVCGVIVAFVLFSAVVRRLVANPWLARAIVVVPAVAVTWWALSPYFGDDVVDEDFPVVADTAGSVDAVTEDPAIEGPSGPPTDASEQSSEPAPTPTEAPTPNEPIALADGTFQGLTGHEGAGTATIYELPDGSRVLRLEDFDVSNGPGLEIHLVPGADQRGPGDGVKLADLKGNVGNQNYDVPPELDLAGEWTILVWCEPFAVEVANATASFG